MLQAPPKFQGLQINVQSETQQDAAGQDQSLSLNGSVRINPSGALICLTNSYNAVMFSPEGMSKKDTGTHYMISERDIRVLKRLGGGASSTVLKGFLLRENKFVAIKRINVLQKEMRHQMLNDIKALIDVPNQPGLIQFYGAFHVKDSGQISIVLECMDGGSLADLLTKVKRIPELILGKLMSKILMGLVYLHKTRHMVHRDIKPTNILINSEGEPKITDFGISAFIERSLAVCHTFLGTVTYMSPERINAETYSTPADIWSLGLLLLECATGKYPYNASVGPLQLMMEVLNEEVPIPKPDSGFSPEFIDFVSQCMRKDPAQRPTAETLLSHPYMTLSRDADVDLRAFMQCLVDPQDKLDELAGLVVWNYYAICGTEPERMRRKLAPFYTERSRYTYEGGTLQGRQAILQHLLGVAAGRPPGTKVLYQAVHVDCQPFGTDGSFLIHTQGNVQTSCNSAAGATTASSPSVAPFSECFLFRQIKPGAFYVASQMSRFIK